MKFFAIFAVVLAVAAAAPGDRYIRSYGYKKTVPCPKNVLVSCAPSVHPVPCSGYHHAPAYHAPAYHAPAPSYEHAGSTYMLGATPQQAPAPAPAPQPQGQEKPKSALI